MAKPVIDDQFWFELSKGLIEGGHLKRDEAGAKLQNMIVWLWGIYTASATIGVALSKTSYSFPVILLIASPSFVLIVAYWVSVWVQMPVSAQFDPRIPQDIKDAYLRGIKIKNRRLNIALALSFAAAILVSFALNAASLSKQATPPNFRAYHHAKEGHDIIALTGRFPADTNIILRITPLTQGGTQVKSKELSYITLPSGELQTNVEMEPTVTPVDKYDVTVEWKEEDGLLRIMKRTVLPEAREK